jgi:5-methylcytosine-specific restriction enzyme subunit McrC
MEQHPGEARFVNGGGRRVIDLEEYRPRLLNRGELSDAEGELLWREHRAKVEVEFPSPRTGQRWMLTCQGWAGSLPVTPDLGLRLRPKVEIGNLFRMLEYAYRLKGFELSGLMDCQSIDDVYERLAHILALRVLDRARKGFQRDYISHEDQLPYLRGRIDLHRTLRSPAQVRIDCSFQEHTADIEDNQILAWTLLLILRTALCRRDEVRGSLRSALRSLQGIVPPVPVAARVCIGRTYNRLNDDYRLLHALCRFFLEGSGPSHERGDRSTIPFLVDMANLFELFVAEWLAAHLLEDLGIREQEKVPIALGMEFSIDLVIYHRSTGKPLCVLDTKYKNARLPSTLDVQQVVAYAEAKGCREAVLVYPSSEARPFEARVGEIRVRSLVFDLSGHLEEAGRRFLGAILSTPDLN